VKIFQRHMVRQHKIPTHMRVCVYLLPFFLRMLDFKPEAEEEEEVPATIQNLEFSTSPNSFCPLVVVRRVRTIFTPSRYVFLDNCLTVLLGWSQADWPSLGNPCETCGSKRQPGFKEIQFLLLSPAARTHPAQRIQPDPRSIGSCKDRLDRG
jgi:hypothetical protein